MRFELRYTQYDSCSILIEWPAIIDKNVLKDILNFKNSIKKSSIKYKVEVINTYSSILIIYNFTIGNVNDKILELRTLYKGKNKVLKAQPLIWEIPVCYDDEFGMDLGSFSKEKELSKLEVILLHTETIYTVYFIGFLPGFLYLGGLDSKLFLDRKTTPNLNVKKGSVAIGGEQTGIYPQDSPGGWHIIGNSPIELFNANQIPPCKINAGDMVKFIPINKQDYKDIQNAINAFNYQLKPINTNA
jgi:inhibitor of KinA